MSAMGRKDMTLASDAVPVKPVGTLLDEAVARFGSAPAMDFLGRVWTYAQLGALVARAAAGFRQLGVRKGVRVGLCLPNTPHFVVCYFAVLKAGGTVVNYNPLYVERELAHQVEDSRTTIMVTLDVQQIYPKVAALLDHTCLERVVVCRMGEVLPPVKGLLMKVLKRSELADIPEDLRHVSFSRLVSSGTQLRPEPVDPITDVAVLQYTGGTTGVPKGAVLTHANLTANVAQVLGVLGDLAREGERVLCALPLFHVFAMTVAMNVGIAMGAELILLPRFEVKQAVKVIARKRPTMFPGVPTIYTAITNVAKGGGLDLSSIRVCISGGAPLPFEVRREFETLTGCRLVEGYGLSEASPVVTCNPIDRPRDGSIGLPVTGTVVEIHSTETPGQLLGVGERGELYVRGPQVMAGYWQRPADTAAALVDGCLRTGDVGYVDADGYVFLVDRIKDLIICGGFNVYPRVVEEALYRHPAVAEAVVIGVPDPYRGQAPKAFVRLRPGMAATPEEIKDFLGSHLSRIEMPKDIELRDELPRTMIGKLSKKELVAEEAANAETAQPASS
jgi:long-chain acyl-CoA synthetase